MIVKQAISHQVTGPENAKESLSTKEGHDLNLGFSRSFTQAPIREDR